MLLLPERENYQTRHSPQACGEQLGSVPPSTFVPSQEEGRLARRGLSSNAQDPGVLLPLASH